MVENVPEFQIKIDDEDPANEEQSFEWNEIELTELRPQIERRKSSVAVSEIEDELNFSQLTADELEDYFDLLDIQEQLLSIQPEVKVKQKKSLYYLISRMLPCKQPKLKPALVMERDRLFAVALTDFDENEHMHFRLLITIYEKLQQKKGHFGEKICQLQNSAKVQSYMLSASSHNLEAPPMRSKSFRRFKHVQSFKLRNSLGNQSVRYKGSLQNSIHNSIQNDGNPNADSGSGLSEVKSEAYPATYEISKRNRSFDSAAPSCEENAANSASQYKYRLNDENVFSLGESGQLAGKEPENSPHLKANNTENSLESFQTSLTSSNFEYLSCGKPDLNSNYLSKGNVHQYASSGHLSINNLSVDPHLNHHAFIKRANYSSRHSLRSGNASWADSSRKSSNASCYSRLSSYSTYNDRVSINLFHRSIRYGEHWQEIGFQGQDPATDLRDLGLLSLFQMCYLLLTNEQIALNAYQLSLHEEQHFPFALTGINLSQICLQTLRQGHLNRILNSKNDVFNTFNLFYCSLFLKFFQLWSDGKKTIVDSNDVLKELRLLAATKPKQLLEKLTNYNNEQSSSQRTESLTKIELKSKADSKSKSELKVDGEQVIEFTDISKVAND